MAQHWALQPLQWQKRYAIHSLNGQSILMEFGPRSRPNIKFQLIWRSGKSCTESVLSNFGISWLARDFLWKVRPKIAFTSTASQSRFDHVSRIQCLKVDLLVYKVPRLSLPYSMVACLFLWETKHDFLSFDTQNVERGRLWCTRNFHHIF